MEKGSSRNTLCRRLTRCEGCLCHEYDHIAGGETAVSNCQILQSRVNKSNKSLLVSNDLKRYSCDLKFTGEICNRRNLQNSEFEERRHP
ncbi:hypothetical protein KC19_8G117900 [Ceratodon purpureus]|uniref:Uncharacterized protein n=1 Tax=Ceratodon purpureus TaxID=3225 RepID=A0A8T0H2E4_CERPU|nr:hypothetical protein KC19_8G117900 [Ceratodon purpureus]KAG0564529.1 hypothetical protein KC19_8G117900 [Ceratodon purpureus]